MNKDAAIEVIWDYMHVNHKLQKSDLIVALGSNDMQVAEYTASLWKEKWAPWIVFSGSGTRHAEHPAWKDFAGRPEAEVFAEIALNLGVPPDVILIENKSQNTGENLKFTSELLEKSGLNFQTAILVQKPFMERRTFTTAKVHWPVKDIIVTSPPFTCKEYAATQEDDWWLHAMVGDLQRIMAYPKFGFQIEQSVPAEVYDAFNHLVDLGYRDYLIEK